MLIDTIEVKGLSESVVKAVGERAEEIGTTKEDYVRYLIEEDIAASLNMRLLFAPVREQIKQSEISEDELDNLLEEAREESFQERQKEKV